MNSTELIAFVKAKVKDDSFADANILQLLNEALLRTAHDLCLPGLQASDDLTFTVGGDLFASLPDDYDHDLWHATNVDDPWQDIEVYTSLHSLQRIHPREGVTGYIRDVAADGSVLHVRPAPNQEHTIRVWYYRRPDLLVIPETGLAPEPEGIPHHLHGPVLAYYAIAKIYDEIEDGVDGNKSNTNNWESKWKRDGFDALASTKGVRRASRSTPVVKRYARFL